MPIHDWTRVDHALFHDFYLGWVTRLSASLNDGVLPSSHYALTETIRDGRRPSFVELPEEPTVSLPERSGGVRLYADEPPRTTFHDVCLHPEYAEKVITIRASSLNNVVAALRIVAADTKRSRYRIAQFVGWAVEVLREGISLLLVDPFPPGPLNPQGIHKAVWDEFIDNDFALPRGKPLTLVSYVGGRIIETFVEPAAIGGTLAAMPLFLNPGEYVAVPLEETYQTVWEQLPSPLKELLDSPPPP
jgi:hypothetical protein